ncbi:MAG: hypothetical protein WCO96_00420 [Actinomycetes bacterium]
MAAAVYGLILTGSILAASGEGERAGEILIFMVLTLTLFWAAHVYSELLSQWATTGTAPDRHRWAAEMRRQWPMVGVCAIPAAILLAAVVDLIKDGTAVVVALTVCSTELALTGFVAAKRGGGGTIARLMSAAIAFGFGVALIVLKAILH